MPRSGHAGRGGQSPGSERWLRPSDGLCPSAPLGWGEMRGVGRGEGVGGRGRAAG